MRPGVQKSLIPENKDGKSHDAPWDGVFCQITASGEVNILSNQDVASSVSGIQGSSAKNNPFFPTSYLAILIFNWWLPYQRLVVTSPNTGGHLYLLLEEPIFSL